MRIGIVGGPFPTVQAALETAFADEGYSNIDVVEINEHAIPKVDVIVPIHSVIDGAMMDATGARLIQQFGVALSTVDLDAARQRGIPVDNVPGAASGNAGAVVEIAMLHLLNLLRRFDETQASVAAGILGKPHGTPLAGRSVGVLGVGDIGKAMVLALRAFGAHPIGIGRRPLSESDGVGELLDAEHYGTDLQATASRCDDLIVCCPLTDDTRGLVDAKVLGELRPGAHIVNVARGSVIDRDALLAALRSGQIAGAGLDVTWTEPIDPHDELLTERVVVTPHIGGVTDCSYAGMAEGFVASVRRHLGE